MFCWQHFYFGLSLVFKKNTVAQEPGGKRNRKQVVLVGPLFCAAYHSQAPSACSGRGVDPACMLPSLRSQPVCFCLEASLIHSVTGGRGRVS